MIRTTLAGRVTRGADHLAVLVLIALLSACGAQPPAKKTSWLSRKYPTAPCESCPELTDQNEERNYYCSIGVTGGTAAGGIDPTGCNSPNAPTLTLADWKAANGFPLTGYPTAHAIYGNLGDLRIGRDMNCSKLGNNIACYVTNYGAPPFDGSGTNAAWDGKDSDYRQLGSAIDDAIAGHSPFATVAMVYNPSAGSGANVVTFYTFAPNGELAFSPALDGEGGKTAPRMCMACHGGLYDESSHTAISARFLPFDVYYFKQSTQPGFSLDDQQEGYRQLNARVRETNVTPAIQEFIDNTYPGGVTNAGSLAEDVYVPAGWSGHERLYNNVVRQYCRTCHMASGLDFRTFAQFQQAAAGIEHAVCQEKSMPNAQVPFTIFWRQDHVARGDLRDFLLTEGIADLHDCK